MDGLSVAGFIAAARARRRAPLPPAEVDPVGLILARVGFAHGSAESRALARASAAVLRGTGQLSEGDLWALSQDALALFDALVWRHEAAAYDSEAIVVYVTRLDAAAAAA